MKLLSALGVCVLSSALVFAEGTHTVSGVVLDDRQGVVTGALVTAHFGSSETLGIYRWIDVPRGRKVERSGKFFRKPPGLNIHCVREFDLKGPSRMKPLLRAINWPISGMPLVRQKCGSYSMNAV